MGSLKKADWSLWKAFLNTNFEILLKTGLPVSYLERQELWEDFLLHGYIDHFSVDEKFTIENMIKAEYKVYMKCIREYFASDFDYFEPALLSTQDLKDTLAPKS